MKNLVLKIIRGSYPPVSVHYSLELRSLLGQLFKRNPRERPSVSIILDKPFLSSRIERFLTPQIIAQEFHHTFIHKQPKASGGQGQPAQKITKPACKYGVPLTAKKVPDVAKKAVDKKTAVKQKLINRINQAREQGWKHVLSSSGGSSPERKVHRGHVPTERAFQVEEFLQRKREALINKVRAEGQLGLRQNLATIFGSRTGSVRCRKPRANKEEEVGYLARLRQIRLQNFNERQQIKARLRGEKVHDGSDSQESSEEAELKRKKIEAVKAQANARVAVLKEQLEKKRREAQEREKKAWEVYVSPVCFTPGFVNHIQYIDHCIFVAEVLKWRSEKRQILRRLNDNLKAQSLVEEVEETVTAEPPSTFQRRQEEMGSSPDHTVDEVSQLSVLQDEGPRKMWGVNPDTQVLKILQEAELQPLTQKLENASICDGELFISGTVSAFEPMSSFIFSILGYIIQSVCVTDPADVESLVLEEQPKPFEPPPADVQQAWEQKVQPPLEEPLFMKLCSPAHRRTAALALLSAQSSADESSSSLASRSRSVSPLRSKHHDSLLIGLSTGMFDANNPKMLRTCSLPDLSRFSSSQRDVEVHSNANVAPENNLEIEDLEDPTKDDDHGEDQCSEPEHQDSIFSRLEELRYNLEQQMGFEKFIEAYNKIKAIHEDEDENIDLGSSLVLNILGTDHQHLYPNILHLVMADGAYQEDNDE
uniref:non-specific serine/threonine protein kinase n=1 Tax=Periophthalmus magnuspinnatus TaxID=409849 RepID=A0A3B4AE66_9GOBI